jgi:hypothetical protein
MSRGWQPFPERLNRILADPGLPEIVDVCKHYEPYDLYVSDEKHWRPLTEVEMQQLILKLRSNQNVKKLHLSHQKLSVDMMREFAPVLGLLTTLQSLGLGGCKMFICVWH